MDIFVLKVGQKRSWVLIRIRSVSNFTKKTIVDQYDIPESKAIAESADSVWAIIRNSQMKKENIYEISSLN